MAHLAGAWIRLAVIAAAIAASQYSGSWLVYILAVMVIGGRMHALGVLMHEAAHYRFFKNRTLNEWIPDVLAAWPVMFTVDGYRRNHLAHHQNTNTDDDPDWVVKLGSAAFTFPQKAWALFKHLAGYVIGVQTILDLRQILPRVSKNDRSTPRYKVLRLGFYAAAVVICAVLHILPQLLLYWIVPFLTMLFLFQHIRSVSEHFGSHIDYSDELDSTRTVIPYLWERAFFCPHNINYHLEHHLYPGVPFYNLPKLHETLMRNPYYRAKAHVTRGYSTGVVKECLA